MIIYLKVCNKLTYHLASKFTRGTKMIPKSYNVLLLHMLCYIFFIISYLIFELYQFHKKISEYKRRNK